MRARLALLHSGEGGGWRAGGAGAGGAGGTLGGALSPRWLAGGSFGPLRALGGALGGPPGQTPAHLMRAADAAEGAEAGGGWRRGSMGTGGGAYIPLAGGPASALSRAAGGRESEAWADVEAQVGSSEGLGFRV